MVTFNSDIGLVRKCLQTLVVARGHAVKRGVLRRLRFALVDNSTDGAYTLGLRQLLSEEFRGQLDEVQFIRPGDNIGYGAGHNRALEGFDSDVHIILNPDVELARDALFVGLDYMRRNPEVVIASPRATDSLGEDQYLCKRYPSVLVLALRGFAPGTVKRWFRHYLYSYEVREAYQGDAAAEVQLVSGCCMFARTAALQRASGFSEEFFMYFEDFDLSMRLHSVGRLVYVPGLNIVHHGGQAARKGLRHVAMFVQSGWKFFQRHGWRWI